MIRTNLTISFVFLVTLIPLAVAETPKGQWMSVLALRPGSELSVRLKNGNSFSGRLVSVSESTLVVESSNKSASASQPDVGMVRLLQGSVKRPALIGMAIGAGGGAAIGLAVGGCRSGDFICFSRSTTVPIVAGVGAVLGTVTGFAIGMNRKQRGVIYRAQNP